MKEIGISVFHFPEAMFVCLTRSKCSKVQLKQYSTGNLSGNTMSPSFILTVLTPCLATTGAR